MGEASDSPEGLVALSALTTTLTLLPQVTRRRLRQGLERSKAPSRASTHTFLQRKLRPGAHRS